MINTMRTAVCHRASLSLVEKSSQSHENIAREPPTLAGIACGRRTHGDSQPWFLTGSIVKSRKAIGQLANFRRRTRPESAVGGGQKLLAKSQAVKWLGIKDSFMGYIYLEAYLSDEES
jgi:hypothetical protein